MAMNFLDIINGRAIRLGNKGVSRTPDLGSETWEDRENTAKRFGEIDFGCRFDGSGCQMTRAGSRGKMACCYNCAYTGGFFETINPSDIPLLESSFDKETGFWREGAGCILPREKRSEVCLTYRCASAHNVTPRAFLVGWLQELANDTKANLKLAYVIQSDARMNSK
jgi:hypothetical protein